MANISTISYNGSVLAETEEPGNVAVIYDGKTIADIGAGETKTFACADKIMKTNLYIGAKTLLCEMSQMISDVIVAVKSAFPEPPSSYVLIGKYTSSQTWTAPEDGYFQIEVFGASGKGGSGQYYYQTSMSDDGIENISAYGTGGGGGGGGYACSRVKLNKGDSVKIVRGAVGSTSSATINSSLETYSKMTVKSGATGGNGTAKTYANATAGTGGAGGTASGGNYKNANGGTGGAGRSGTHSSSKPSAGGTGGKAGATGGNAGGAGGAGSHTDKIGSNPKTYEGASGKAGFIKIYRGNTNIA